MEGDGESETGERKRERGKELQGRRRRKGVRDIEDEDRETGGRRR